MPWCEPHHSCPRGRKERSVSILGSSPASVTERSTVITLARKLGHRVADVGSTAARYARSSFLYRWLTKEPEPEVVVIDLRETRTVGPFVRLLDGSVERVAPYWRASRLSAGLDRLGSLVDRGLRTRPGRLLVALLEPPEPPESTDLESLERSDENGCQNDVEDDRN